jgi:hypothetical protein
VAWAMRQRSVSTPRSSNRTRRFPATGFPTGFIVGHTSPKMHASKAQHAKILEDIVVRELARASALHLVPSGEEVSNAFIDIVVDRPVGLQPSAIAKVRGPSAQECV